MSQEDFKCFSCLIFFQSDHYPVHQIDICFKRHLKAETIGESNVFSDGLENHFILLGNYYFGGKAKIPELDKQ